MSMLEVKYWLPRRKYWLIWRKLMTSRCTQILILYLLRIEQYRILGQINLLASQTWWEEMRSVTLYFTVHLWFWFVSFLDIQIYDWVLERLFFKPDKGKKTKKQGEANLFCLEIKPSCLLRARGCYRNPSSIMYLNMKLCLSIRVQKIKYSIFSIQNIWTYLPVFYELELFFDTLSMQSIFMIKE